MIILNKHPLVKISTPDNFHWRDDYSGIYFTLVDLVNIFGLAGECAVEAATRRFIREIRDNEHHIYEGDLALSQRQGEVMYNPAMQRVGYIFPQPTIL